MNKYKNDDSKFFEDSLKMQTRLRAEQQSKMAKEYVAGMEDLIAFNKYHDKYNPIIDTFIMDLPRDKKIEVLKALDKQDTEKLEALIKKYTSKPITLKKMPDYEFNIPTKIKSAKPNANQNYDDKYRPIVDTFIMNLSREEKFEVLKALHNQDTKKLEALIKKYTSKPSVSAKQQSKVIKEIDNMLKDINKIIDDHKPVTIKAEIKTVKKRGRPPKTTTIIDVNTKSKSKPKPRGRPRLTEEEKKDRREVRKEATRLRNIEKKENMKRIKAEAKAKLEEHKLAIEEEKKRLSRADMRKSKEIDELKSDFTMFRRYVKYLPTPDEVEHLDDNKVQSIKDYSEEAEQYYNNAVDTYKRYKKEGLINKSDLDKLLELFEVKHYLDILNNVKNALNN